MAPTSHPVSQIVFNLIEKQPATICTVHTLRMAEISEDQMASLHANACFEIRHGICTVRLFYHLKNNNKKKQDIRPFSCVILAKLSYIRFVLKSGPKLIFTKH